VTESPDDLLALALETARRAGRLLVSERPAGDLERSTKSSPTDVVTVMDTAAERMIVDALRTARPGDGVLGEEGADDPGTSGVRWVIDPIDGTVNYLYRLPAWAVSIAAERDGEVVAGVVHAPAMGETYTATLGGGAFCDGVRLACTRDVQLEQALVATGFGYERQRRASQARVLTGVLPAVRDIRRAGSCAIDLCLLAAGRVDAYYERGPMPWDIAAGALIAREAGARVEGLHGEPASERFTLAAGTGLFERLRDLLGGLDPEHD
jgi:myo-inositol-1(or 4)-monophosphatase